MNGITLSCEWKRRVADLINNMSDVFTLHDLDYGQTDIVKHCINRSDSTPFKQRARPIHSQDADAVRKHLKELLDAGIIRESESPLASKVVVRKIMMCACVNFRKLNSRKLNAVFVLMNSKWFSVLDLKSGFYQIEMEEADKQKMAFVCPLGF